MQAGIDYDTTNFHALQDELRTLNESALAAGLVAARDGLIVSPKPARARRGTRKATAPEPAAPARAPGRDSSRAAAARLLAMLGRRAQDESRAIAGTPFTEAGVARLLAHLRKRRTRRGGAWLGFLTRAERYLGRPVSSGIRTIEGVGIERLQVFARQLEDIAADGWAQFRAARAVRRRRLAPVDALAPDHSQPAPATPRRKGASR